MSRTIRDIPVCGRTLREVRNEVSIWMKAHKVKVLEDTQNCVRGRIGLLPGWLSLTAPKHFEMNFRQDQDTIIVHIEGFVELFGVSESDFSPDDFVGTIPRRKGQKAIEDLCNRLRSMSSKNL